LPSLQAQAPAPPRRSRSHRVLDDRPLTQAKVQAPSSFARSCRNRHLRGWRAGDMDESRPPANPAKEAGRVSVLRPLLCGVRQPTSTSVGESARKVIQARNAGLSPHPCCPPSFAATVPLRATRRTPLRPWGEALRARSSSMTPPRRSGRCDRTQRRGRRSVPAREPAMMARRRRFATD